jgi:hypothetical protein
MGKIIGNTNYFSYLCIMKKTYKKIGKSYIYMYTPRVGKTRK